MAHLPRNALVNWFVASFILTSVTSATVGSSKRNVKTGCVFTYSDFGDKEPVLLHSNYTVIEPRLPRFAFTSGANIVVTCPGSKNVLEQTEQDINLAKCAPGNKIQIEDTSYELKDLSCHKSVTGSVEVTNTACANGRGIFRKIGHKVSNRMLTLVNICYDDDQGGPLYSEHTLYGTSIKYAKKESHRSSFKTEGLASDVAADVSFKRRFQKSSFDVLLKSAAFAENYINAKSFLSRGHLSPDGDFIYASSQFSTYFYINVVPQWQAINNANWKSLEAAVRDTASRLLGEYRIITGGHGVLTLPDADGVDTEIYLMASKKKIPVPKFMWKIMQSLKDRKAIAFVNLNNPFIARVKSSDYLCKNICEEYNWGSTSWGNPQKGLLYCCDVKTLRKTIPTIPNLVVNGTLAAR